MFLLAIVIYIINSWHFFPCLILPLLVHDCIIVLQMINLSFYLLVAHRLQRKLYMLKRNYLKDLVVKMLIMLVDIATCWLTGIGAYQGLLPQEKWQLLQKLAPLETNIRYAYMCMCYEFPCFITCFSSPVCFYYISLRKVLERRLWALSKLSYCSFYMDMNF